MKAGSTAMTQRPRDRVPSGSLLTLLYSRRPDRANPPTNFWWSLFESTGMIYLHSVPTGQTVNKEYYVEVLREFRKRFSRKRPALFKSCQWHFHKDNAPVHNSILVTDYWHGGSSRQFLSLPIVQTSLPVIFWLFLKPQRLWLWDNWGDERGCDEGYWHAHTRGLSWGLPEVVGMVEQVHCNRRRLLRRGVEFPVCTINKSAHTKKVWKLI